MGGFCHRSMPREANHLAFEVALIISFPKATGEREKVARQGLATQ
jgi:hypothetical protein